MKSSKNSEKNRVFFESNDEVIEFCRKHSILPFGAANNSELAANLSRRGRYCALTFFQHQDLTAARSVMTIGDSGFAHPLSI